jgi:hypothetical protein
MNEGRTALHHTAGKKKQIGDHALPQRGFGLSTPEGAEGGWTTPGETQTKQADMTTKGKLVRRRHSRFAFLSTAVHFPAYFPFRPIDVTHY